ncbi:MAG: type IV pilus biogenesis/stability protein PilW [Gammaproteobacteria bacterium]|nr:type IV pilus biogenesis/stability protein PilW [Gammaproteobacteria bacterium]
MSARRLAATALAAALALGGCASSGGDLAPGANPKQAAIDNVQLSVAYLKLGKLAVARHFIERALGEDPRNATVQATAGVVYERLGEASKARRAYREAASLGRRDPDVMNTYGGYLCRTHHYAEGEKVFREVIANPLYQTPEVAMVNAGVCLEGADNDTGAENYFKRALVMRPNMPEALLELADLAMKRGDPARAAKLIRQDLAVNPPSAPVLWLGVRAERALGHSNAADAYAGELARKFPTSTEARMLQAGVGS